MIIQFLRIAVILSGVVGFGSFVFAGELPEHKDVGGLLPDYTIEHHLNPKQSVQSPASKLSTSLQLNDDLTLHSSEVPRCAPVYAQPECPVGSIKSKNMFNFGVTYYY